MSQKKAAELDAQRGDETRWKQEPIDIEVRSNPAGSQVVSFRMPSVEFEEMLEAAKEAGESMSKYIRDAIKLR